MDVLDGAIALTGRKSGVKRRNKVLLSGAIVGNGVGPIFTGWLSDLIHLRTGGDGLRYALAVVVCMLLPAMLAFGYALRAYPAAHRAALPPAPH